MSDLFPWTWIAFLGVAYMFVFFLVIAFLIYRRSHKKRQKDELGFITETDREFRIDPKYIVIYYIAAPIGLIAVVIILAKFLLLPKILPLLQILGES